MSGTIATGTAEGTPTAAPAGRGAPPAAPPDPEGRATPIGIAQGDLEAVAFNAEGLVPAIIQERETGKVLMFAWMNEDSLRQTLDTGRTWFWSRSRQQYWLKGESSGNFQWVREAYYDCDGDVLLFLVDQDGDGACHTGNYSCFYRSFGGSPEAG